MAPVAGSAAEAFWGIFSYRGIPFSTGSCSRSGAQPPPLGTPLAPVRSNGYPFNTGL
jgi:hypothetical protein